MKRILIFSTAYLPFIGGAEVAIKELTDRIDEFEFDLITAKLKSDLPAKEQIGKVTVYRVGFGIALDKFLLPLFGTRLALRLHKTQSYSLVWAMMASQASVAAVWFKKISKLKLLTTLQEGDEEEHLVRYVFGNKLLFNIFIKPWHTLAIKNADHVQAISKYLAHRAKTAGAKCPITVIPNGVDIKLFTKEISDDVKDKLRKDLGIEKNEKVIIHAGRLAYKNGLDILIKAFTILSSHYRNKFGTGSELDSGSNQTLKQVQSDNNVKLLLMGSGKKEQKLKELTHELGLSDRVIFTGRYENADLPKYLNISDVFVRPSRSEGQGISFIEAMAAGVPIIAPEVGGIPDFLEDRKTGLFMKVDDPEDLADKINLLFEDESLRDSVTRNAKELIKKKYDWHNISDEINNLFIKLTNNKS